MKRFEKSDNGAVEDKNAPIGRKTTRSSVKDVTALTKELQEERDQNASLRSKLRKVRNDKKQLEQSLGDGSSIRMHSTMREDNTTNDHNSILMSSMSNLSFASLQVPECKPVDGEDEIDRKTYEQWKGLLEASMQLAGVTDETTKMNIFKIKAGAKLLEILDETVSCRESPDATSAPYSNATHRLGSFFGSRDYIFMQRQKLRSLTQKSGETDASKRVIAVAKLCDFNGENLAEQVADSIQSHALNRKVREAARKILRKGGELGDLLDRVRALEMDQLNEEMFAKSYTVQVAAVAADGQRDDHKNNRFRNPNYHHNSQQRTFGNWRSDNSQQRTFGNWRSARGRGFGRREFIRNTATQQTVCWRCLSKIHQPTECWAIDKNCHNCQRKGHLERACRQMPSPGPIKRRISNDDKESSSSSKKFAVIKDEEECPVDDCEVVLTDSLVESFSSTNELKASESKTELEISSQINVKDQMANSSIQSEILLREPTKAIQALKESSDFEINGIIFGIVSGLRIPFLIDSGAEVNTIGDDTFENLMNNEQSKAGLICLKEGSDKPLRAYTTSEQIKVVATFVAKLVITDDRPSLLEKFYVIKNARALLGRNIAVRYSVLQLGLNVPIRPSTDINFPGEICAVTFAKGFPMFSMAPVVLRYDESMPPSRKIFTSIPPAFRAETERRLNDLLGSGIIERVTDSMDKSYCSSLLVVPKGKKDIRLVVDLRGPNKAIIRTPFKMPTLESILTDLSECKWFSTIDLTSAFFHVVLDEKSRHLTNFFAGSAMYRFQRLPFGLTNAPDIFQEALQTIVLAGCKGVRNYLDDILVSGKTKSEHDENLKIVLERLHEHNVCINEEKSVYGQQSVKFLGFQVSHDGLRVEEEKVKAIRGFRRPDSQQEVKSFLGLMNFTERFIQGRAEKTEHLRNLAKADSFYWGSEEEKEFIFLKKEALKSIHKLGYFNDQDETELFVDASPIGLGAVLVQFNKEGVPRIISCASKALTETERKYPQTQKEALAMVWGIERFTFYLIDKTFAVRTDAEANEFIFGKGLKSNKRAITRAESWALRLQAYDFTVKRIPGHLNVADALSRLISKSQIDEPFEEDDEKHLLYSLDAGSMNITWQDIQTESENDPDVHAVRAAIESGLWPKDLVHYEAQSRDLRVFGSMVFKEDKVVLPLALRFKALKEAHQGHIGCLAMKRIIRDYFWWPGMSADIVKFAKTCNTCIIISRKNPPIPLSSRLLPDGPWEILQVDFLTVHGCGSGEFMVMTDTYSRYLTVIEMKSTDAKSTNEALQKVFVTWGLPLILQSDNGPPFQSSEFIGCWEAKGVKVRKSLPLCPQTNGAVERQNQGIIKALAAAKVDGSNWRSALHNYVHVHNTLKPHARLGITPFELLVGWKYRGIFPTLWDPNSTDTVDRTDVREMDATTKLLSQKYADNRRGAKYSDISVGDIVVMAIPKKSKTEPTFSKERYTVLSRDGAKIVLRSDRGVQYTRNVNDLKRASMSNNEGDINPVDNHVATSENKDEPLLRSDNNAEGFVKAAKVRPQRSIRKPEKYKDMFMYSIYQ